MYRIASFSSCRVRKLSKTKNSSDNKNKETFSRKRLKDKETDLTRSFVSRTAFFQVPSLSFFFSIHQKETHFPHLSAFYSPLSHLTPQRERDGRSFHPQIRSFRSPNRCGISHELAPLPHQRSLRRLHQNPLQSHPISRSRSHLVLVRFLHSISFSSRYL